MRVLAKLQKVSVLSRRTFRSALLAIMIYPLIYFVSLNYLNIYLFPRRSLIEVALPKSVEDKGVFEDLNQEFLIPVPLWLPKTELRLELSPQGKLLGLVFSDHVLALFTWNKKTQENDYKGLDKKDYELLEFVFEEELAIKLKQSQKKGMARRSSKVWRDHDRDHIPDSLDIHLGLMKSMINHARYDESYHGVSYPMGDVNRKVGVCTDVVVRAYRNAGINLQERLIKDMYRSPRSYDLKNNKKPSKGYEHRRVRRLYPYFKRHFKKLSTQFDQDAKGRQAWLPGDIVFMDMNPNSKRPTHVGLIAGHIQVSGFPLLAHNAARFFYASEHDILFAQPLIARFRITLPR